MAYTITDACTQCDLCVDVCPISAIEPGDPVYVIDDTCCDFEECLIVCPEDAIVPIADFAGDGASTDVELESRAGVSPPDDPPEK